MGLDKAFHQKYRGGVVDEFLQALSKYESMYRYDTYHGKIISIQQSHGTGKSRLVEELGNHVRTFVYTVCPVSLDLYTLRSQH